MEARWGDIHLERNKGPTGALTGKCVSFFKPLKPRTTRIFQGAWKRTQRPWFAARGVLRDLFSFPAAIRRPREATSPPALTQGRGSRPLWAGSGGAEGRGGWTAARSSKAWRAPSCLLCS